MNGFPLACGDKLMVTSYQPPERKQNSSDRRFTNLYVKNFPTRDMDEGQLVERFSKYGEISSAVVMRDENGQPRGFGFVCFKDPMCASNALAEHSESGLYVREALTKEQRQVEINRMTLNFKKSMQFLSLHVKGFNAMHTTTEDLHCYFSTFGEVKNVKMTPTGAALVSFVDRDAARRARDQSNGS
jgi:polyadenylate-binding protein